MHYILIFLFLFILNFNVNGSDLIQIPKGLKTIESTKGVCEESIKSFFFAPSLDSQSIDKDMLKFYNLSVENYRSMPEDSREKLVNFYEKIKKNKAIEVNENKEKELSFWGKTKNFPGTIIDITKGMYDDIKEILTKNSAEENKNLTNFDILKQYWNLSDEDFNDFAKKSQKQLDDVAIQFGVPLNSYEFISSDNAGSSFVKHTYIIKYQTTAIRYACVFYKPSDKWIVHSINWDNMISLIFK